MLVHLLERGLDPQAAIDQPRFRIGFGGVLSRSSPVTRSPKRCPTPPPVRRDRRALGAVQVAGIDGDGGRTAGADPRRHGAATRRGRSQSSSRSKPLERTSS